MLKSIKGVCRNGQVELLEPPPEGGNWQVIVTFVASNQIDLTQRGIDQELAADLRQRLATFAEDWQRPEMNAYDDI